MEWVRSVIISLLITALAVIPALGSAQNADVSAGDVEAPQIQHDPMIPGVGPE